jgi:hypothetical protein
MLVTELYAQLGFEFDKAAFSQAQAALGGIHEGLAKIAALAVGAAVGFLAMVTSMVNQGKEIENTSQALGLSTDQLQDWRNAARFAGVESNAFVVGIRHLSNMMHEARLGNANVAYSLYELGVHGKNANDALMHIADTVSKMPDGLEKTARVNMVFGARMGSKLIPILNLGRKGILSYMEAARELGTTLSKDTIRRTDEAYLSQVRMKMAFEGLRNAIIGPFLDSANKYRDQLTNWIKLHRAVIASGFKDFFEKLSKTFKDTKGALDLLVGATSVLWNSLKLEITAVTTVAGWLDTLASKSIWLKGIMVAVALAIGVAFLPVTTAIAAIMLVFDDIQAYMEGRGSLTGIVVGGFKQMWGDIKEWTNDATDAVLAFFDKLAEWVIPEPIRQLMELMATKVSADNADASSRQAAFAADPESYNQYVTTGKGRFGSGVTVGNVTTTINVSGAGDPHAVAQEINQSFADQFSSTLQEAHAQLGAPPTRQN